MKMLMEFFNITTYEIVLYIIMALCIWLLIREFRTWYWKINDIVAEQEKQTRILEEMLYTINPRAKYFDEIENDEKTP